MLEEGVDCWKPIKALEIGEGVFKIIENTPDPNDELWEFAKDDVVICIEKEFSDGKIAMVADRKIE